MPALFIFLFSTLSPLEDAGDPEFQPVKCTCYGSASMGPVWLLCGCGCCVVASSSCGLLCLPSSQLSLPCVQPRTLSGSLSLSFLPPVECLVFVFLLVLILSCAFDIKPFLIYCVLCIVSSPSGSCSNHCVTEKSDHSSRDTQDSGNPGCIA